jgi:hypothetical protein
MAPPKSKKVREKIVAGDRPSAKDSNIELFVSVKDQIRKAPSVDLWREEIESIFDGERNHDIERLGDVTEHIEVLIGGAKDPKKARRVFREALNRLFEEWNPYRSRPSGELYYTLALIEGFTPRSGFVKLTGFLREGNTFPGTYSTPIGIVINFQRMAIVSLGEYYPAAPPSAREDSAYMSYLDVLNMHLRHAEHFRYVSTRLLDLNEMDYDSLELQDGILRDPGVLPAVLRTLLDPVKDKNVHKNVTSLYRFCKGNGLEDEILEALMEFGELKQRTLTLGHKDRADDHDHIHPSVFLLLPDKYEVEISLPDYVVKEKHTFEFDDFRQKISTLLQKYDAARPPEKRHVADAIREEVRGLVDFSYSSRAGDIDFTEIESAFTKEGVKLQFDPGMNNFEFIFGENSIPIPMSARQTLGFLGQPLGREAWEPLVEKAEQRISTSETIH